MRDLIGPFSVPNLRKLSRTLFYLSENFRKNFYSQKKIFIRELNSGQFLREKMRISRFLHPITYEYLVEKGYAPANTSVPAELPPMDPLLRGLFSDTSDDYLYLMKPVFLDIIRTYYPHDDAVVCFNNFISDRYPKSTSESRSCILG